MNESVDTDLDDELIGDIAPAVLNSTFNMLHKGDIGNTLELLGLPNLVDTNTSEVQNAGVNKEPDVEEDCISDGDNESDDECLAKSVERTEKSDPNYSLTRYRKRRRSGGR
ncbi:uncharacterized protein LOC130656558 [Hydractinia symbiolongicarpus]|uniref:uncharacterized protein LOC130656558 n=1 Tax=Hydractinia symbiolongicarpus TaxID=13093 RepID=UPI00254E4A80|nr:uncharacterized protein LOC130656558 [Hydractinia symbiolongicarpus]XP_057315425.1 uncharacterized protein LOC130656558 [Hydractinia symbiolongicarpus]XP_057315426.1 uncharacterized protein LOC130656558 [Hydractinia symbiolongicarpus]